MSAQQFLTSTASQGSFNRWTADLRHEIPLYRRTPSQGPRSFNGPNECGISAGSASCPPVQWSRNRQGTITLRLLVVGSSTSGDNRVPFYLQPTLGGSDLNGERLLAGYDDYRFRGPNLIAMQEGIEHSLWGPVGLFFMAEHGKVAEKSGDLGFNHLSHSAAIGLTLRAGGFPMVNLVFAFGGEANHVITSMNNTLLGGSSRPSLYQDPPLSRITAWLASVALALAPALGAQQQASNPRAGFPCGARLDPSYFQVAEGSGGHLLLLAPEEIGDSAALLTAFGNHPQTIFRLAGDIKPGVHEFRVPVDSSVESVLFSISVQCMGVAEVLNPSGAPAGGAEVTDLSNFRAERLVVVKRPEPGVWTIRASGSGIAGVMAQAKSALGIDVEFSAAGSAEFTRVPHAGVENVVRIRVSGRVTGVEASIVTGAFVRLATLPLTAGDTDGTYVTRFTPGTAGFRVLVEGKDPGGRAIQRVHAPLFGG